jgi:1-deoxy-D-xylulose-5-phosphate synthase
LLVIEDGCKIGGFGSAVLEYLSRKGIVFAAGISGLPDMPIPQGGRRELLDKFGLSAAEIANQVILLATRGWTLVPRSLDES